MTLPSLGAFIEGMETAGSLDEFTYPAAIAGDLNWLCCLDEETLSLILAIVQRYGIGGPRAMKKIACCLAPLSPCADFSCPTCGPVVQTDFPVPPKTEEEKPPPTKKDDPPPVKKDEPIPALGCVTPDTIPAQEVYK